MGRPGRAVAGLGSALANKDIRRVELSWAVAIAAEWAHFVALGVFSYRAGGPSLVGWAGLIRLAPAGLIAPFASSLGDRSRRERFLLLLMLVEAGALVGSGLAALGPNTVPVLALSAVVGLASTVVRPTVQSLLPSLARTPEELIATNGITSVFEGVGALVGPLVAGVSFFFTGTAPVFIASGAAVTAASLVLLGVGDIGVGSLWGGPGGKERSHPIRSSAAGCVAVAREPRLRLVVGLAGAQCFVRGCLNVLLVVVAFRLLHAGSQGVGYLNGAIGVGGLAGALVATTLSPRRLALSFGISIVFWGLPIALLAPLSELGLAMVCTGVVGVANAVEDVALVTLLQRSAPDELLSRVLGVLWG